MSQSVRYSSCSVCLLHDIDLIQDGVYFESNAQQNDFWRSLAVRDESGEIVYNLGKNGQKVAPMVEIGVYPIDVAVYTKNRAFSMLYCGKPQTSEPMVCNPHSRQSPNKLSSRRCSTLLAPIHLCLLKLNGGGDSCAMDPSCRNHQCSLARRASIRLHYPSVLAKLPLLVAKPAQLLRNVIHGTKSTSPRMLWTELFCT